LDRQRDPRRRVRDDRVKRRHRPPRSRGVGGDGEHPRVETAEKPCDVVEPRRIEEERRLPRLGIAPEDGRDRTGAGVELGVRER